MQRTIPELLDALASSDVRTAGIAGHELISRPDECTPFIDPLIDCLGLPNCAIVEFARITIERMGEKCMPKLLARFEQTAGELRLRYLGLIATCVDLPTLLVLLPRELRSGDLASRFFAASCIIYRLYSEVDMDVVCSELIQESVELLKTSRTDPTRDPYWAFARMALKHCGVLSANAR